MRLGEPGTVRRHVMHRFLDALVHFSERERSPGLRPLSRMRICELYMRKIEAAATGGALLAVSRRECLAALPRSGRTLPTENALSKALHDVARRVNDAVVNLRTNGSLVISPPGDLDAPLEAPPARRRVVFKGQAETDVIRLALPARMRVRAGATVRVAVEAADLIEDRAAPLPISAATLSRLIGAASLGGDAVADSEQWES
jgi:hypothetical protein